MPTKQVYRLRRPSVMSWTQKNGLPQQYIVWNERLIAWTDYVITGPNHVNWKEMLKRGDGVITYLDGFRRKLNWNPGSVTRTHAGTDPFGCYVRGNRVLVTMTDYIPSFSWNQFTINAQKANDKASENLINDYRKVLTKWSSGQFIGELAETVRFLVSPCRTLVKHTGEMIGNMRRIQHKNWRRAKRRASHPSKQPLDSQALKHATDTWLGYRFGAVPLLNDVRDANRALQGFLEHNPETVIRLKGSGKWTEEFKQTVRGIHSYSDKFGRGTVGDSTLFDFDYYVKEEQSFIYIGAFKSSVPSGEMPFWDAIGLSPDQWVPTVYEIIPLSFMVDYFSNMGKVIDAASFQMINLHWLCYNKRQDIYYKVSPLRRNELADPLAHIFESYGYGGGVEDRHVLVQRGATSTVTVPTLRFKIPGAGQGLNTLALINSMTSLVGR